MSTEDRMALDLELFRGLTPYATELFGIYQPLLGWKSKRKRHWVKPQSINQEAHETEDRETDHLGAIELSNPHE